MFAFPAIRIPGLSAQLRAGIWVLTLSIALTTSWSWAQSISEPRLTGLATEFQPQIDWSGRINSIARDPGNPQIVIVSTPSGGLFRSNNGGTSWTHVDSFPTFYTSDVVIHPDNPSLVIASARRDYKKFRVLPAWLERPGDASGSEVLSREYSLLVQRLREVSNVPVPSDSLSPAFADRKFTQEFIDLLTIETSGGGIWVSHDSGSTWHRPSSAVPRATGEFSSSRICPPRYSAYAISVEPGTGRIFVGTDCGVSISSDRGFSWEHKEIPGLPKGTGIFAIKALGDGFVLAGSNTRIFWSNDSGNTWSRDSGAPGGVGSHGYHAIGDMPVRGMALAVIGKSLFRVQIGSGAPTWLQIPVPQPASGCGGIPFARAYFGNPGSHVSPSKMYLFYGNECKPYAATASASAGGTGFPNSATDWIELPQSHWDTRYILPDLARGNAVASGGTDVPTVGGQLEPVVDDNGLLETQDEPDYASVIAMIGNDGGLDIYNSSDMPVPIGSGPGKINALQIYDVKGQTVGSTRHDLYFGTQDNRFFASTDFGQTWPHSTPGGEGFALDMARSVSSATDTVVTFFWGSPWSTRRSGAGFANIQQWDDPYDETKGRSGYPLILAQDTRVQIGWTEPTVKEFHLYRTRDLGQTWTKVADLDAPIRSGIEVGPNVFVGIKAPSVSLPFYSGSRDSPNFALAVVRNAINGTNIQTEYPAMRGLVALGVVPTNWNWYLPYGLDSGNPNRILAADVGAGVMAESVDLGENWDPMPALTQILTRGGAFYFASPDHLRKRHFPLVSAISFHPNDSNRILIGTRQSGVFVTGDGGTHWELVYESQRMPTVTDIYWADEDEAVLSTYGRGLWRIELGWAVGLTPRTPPDDGDDPDPIIDICSQFNCRATSFDDAFDMASEPLTRASIALARADGGFLVLGGRLEIENGRADDTVTLSENARVVHLMDADRIRETGMFPEVQIPLARFGKQLHELHRETHEAEKSVWVGVLIRGEKLAALITADSELPAPAADRQTKQEHAKVPPMSTVPALHDQPHITIQSEDMVNGWALVHSQNPAFTVIFKNFPRARDYSLRIDGNVHMKGVDIEKSGDRVKTVQVELEELALGHHEVAVFLGDQLIAEDDLFVIHQDTYKLAE